MSLGTNVGTQPLAFQNWRRFKEAFTPELVARAVTETPKSLRRQVKTCVDPFAGSGTTPLACQFLGVAPVAIEVNPYLADLIEAKLIPIDSRAVGAALAEVLDTSYELDPSAFYSGAPPTFVAPGVKGRYLFSADVASRLASLLNAIMRIRDNNVRRLLRVMLGSAAIEVCNATVSGKGRRYRKNWQNRTPTVAQLDNHFVRGVQAAVYDSARFPRSRVLSFELIRGDARQELRAIKESDLAVFSPPYPNSFDYTDVYNIELWVLGYLTGTDENTLLRRRTLRSHVQIKRNMASPSPATVVAKAIYKLSSKSDLWNPWIPDMIGAYFEDLRTVMGELYRILPGGGRAYVVLGDSRYSGIHIPVIAGFCEMVAELGYNVSDVEPLSSKRTSPQQGGRKELLESLITLIKS